MGGSFYPEGLAQKRQLEHIGRVFDTVEVNGSFYSLLSPRTYRSWAEQTPPNFRFAVKGSRFITHNKKLGGDIEAPLANFFASGVLALGNKLGPVLWQLPRTQRFDAERVGHFLELLPRTMDDAALLAEGHDARVKDPLTTVAETGHTLRHVVEARHESFFTDEAVRVLRKAGVALAVSDSGDWPLAEEVTAGFVYVRLHGNPSTYRSRYGDDALDRWAEKIRAWLRGSEPAGARRVTERVPPRRKSYDVYVYFDNDALGHAPHDALRLRERLDATATADAQTPIPPHPHGEPHRHAVTQSGTAPDTATDSAEDAATDRETHTEEHTETDAAREPAPDRSRESAIPIRETPTGRRRKAA